MSDRTVRHLHPLLQDRIEQVESPDRAVIATDPEGRVVYWGSGAETLYGWTADEALGQGIIDLTPAELATRDATGILETLRSGEPWSGEFMVRARDGSRFTAHVTDMPVKDETGTLVGIIGISRRVTYLDQRATAKAPRRRRRS